MDVADFQDLVKHHEGETLDFKAEGYSFSGLSGVETDVARGKFVKDIISMWNTPREETSHIVLGVRKHPDGKYEFLGISKHEDDATFQQKLSDWVYPIPSIEYDAVNLEGKDFGVITIPVDRRRGPCLPTRDVGRGPERGLLRRNQVYWRRGSTNVEATVDEQRCIYDWFRQSDSPIRKQRITGDATWDEFMQSVHHFSSRRKFVLASVPIRLEPPMLRNLGLVDWTLVLDFDPDSERQGVLGACSGTVERRRGLHRVVRNERMDPKPGATYWYFCRGLTGRIDTDAPRSWKDWLAAYGEDLRKRMTDTAKAILPNPVTMVVVWDGSTSVRYLDSVLAAAIEVFSRWLTVVVTGSGDLGQLESLAADYEARILPLPVHQLCAGLASLEAAEVTSRGECSVPSDRGTPMFLEEKKLAWLSEELEVVHSGIGLRPPEGRVIERDFLRGYEIAWYELGVNSDIERDLTHKVETAVRNDLDARRATRINLFHTPGGGGTTTARRMVWNLRWHRPCVLLKAGISDGTVDRLNYVVQYTSNSVLLVLDGGTVTDRQADWLYQRIEANHLPVVVLHVQRRFEPPQSKPRSFYLSSELSDGELDRLLYFLRRVVPERSKDLEDVVASDQPNARTPFFLSLVAFERNFTGLPAFVRARLSDATPTQKQIMKQLAIAHHYGQLSISPQAFADLLGIPAAREVNVADAMGAQLREVLIESSNGKWRTAHPLIAEECLRQLLTPSASDPRNWKQQLSEAAKDFITFARGTTPFPSDEALELVRKVFVYRENSEIIGTESAGRELFSSLVDDIPLDMGKLEVLGFLTSTFPDEAHFWAHYGRLYSILLKEHEKALNAIDRALELQPNDNVLHHMKGMALRNVVYSMIAGKQPLADVVREAEIASESFAQARRLAPEEEHGYISEVQLRLRVLDYAQARGSSNPMASLAGYSALPWLTECPQAVEGLLAQVRHNRLGQAHSELELRCRADLDSLYGRFEQALQTWDSLLSRRDVYAPPIRRQIAWTYLARKNRDWRRLDQREISRIVNLLETNMKEETDDHNIRLWLRAVRCLDTPPSLEAAIEKVAYWKTNSDSLDAAYYLYVLYCLQSLAGFATARERAEMALKECRERTRFRIRRTASFEWLGHGDGLRQLVHQDYMSEWDEKADFWKDFGQLRRINGVIARIRKQEAGEIELPGGIRAFFVPVVSGHVKGTENKPVSCYVGFSYDGPRAWSVLDA